MKYVSIVACALAGYFIGNWVADNYDITPINNHKIKQPYVIIQTEEQLHPHDTLHVIEVTKDTIWIGY